jgi:hypothetical protein
MFCPSSLVAALLCTLALPWVPSEAPTPIGLDTHPETCPEDQVTDAPAIDARLAGLWQRHETLHEGDPMRFYFFHPDGFGIYRYGKVGLTNTHSFDYGGSQGVVDLRFRKTGEAHAVRYRFEQSGGRTWLVLAGDPREEAAEVRYFKPEGPNQLACALGPLTLPDLADGTPPTGALGNRLWGEEVRYATGGMGFSIYQLQPQAIDGRGVGWHHRGDYDEWTTEALTFRQQGERLALSFPLRHEVASTSLALWTGNDGVRRLRIDEDPRDFWRPHTYRDMGPSFACTP